MDLLLRRFPSTGAKVEVPQRLVRSHLSFENNAAEHSPQHSLRMIWQTLKKTLWVHQNFAETEVRPACLMLVLPVQCCGDRLLYCCPPCVGSVVGDVDCTLISDHLGSVLGCCRDQHLPQSACVSFEIVTSTKSSAFA